MLTSPVKIFHRVRDGLPGSTSIAPATRYRNMEVILKVTERCNINCTYCYFFNSTNQDFHGHPPYLQEITVHKLALFLTEAIKDSGVESLQIDLHGGEPMLMKKDRFDAMCTHLREHLEELCELRLSIQTNAMLVDREWIEIFQKHQIHVGVSIDGPQEYHDQNRVDHKGRGTYAATKAGLDMLREARDNGSLQLSIICVINPDHNARFVFEHFVHELGIRNLHFLFPDETHDSFDTSQLSKFSEYVKTLLVAWSSLDDSRIRIRFLSKTLGLLTNGRESLQIYNANRESSLAFTVASNGDLGPDDDFRNIEPLLFRTGASIFNTKLFEFLNLPEIKAFQNSKKVRPQKCIECCWSPVCDAGTIVGSAVQNFSHEDRYSNPNVYCSVLQDLFVETTQYALQGGVPFERIAEVMAR